MTSEILSLLFPIMLLWGVALLILLFRRGVEWVWKITAILLFLFYLFWFHGEILAGLELYRKDLAASLVELSVKLFHLLGVILLLLWPFGLVAIMRSPPPFVRYRLRNLILLTLLYWMLWALSVTAGDTIRKRVLEWIPRKIEWKIPYIP